MGKFARNLHTNQKYSLVNTTSYNTERMPFEEAKKEFKKLIAHYRGMDEQAETEGIEKTSYDKLAEKLGMTGSCREDTIKKKIYWDEGKPMTRDFIIAMCAVLHMDEEHTNQALKLYGYYRPMPELNSENGRDCLLIYILKKQRENPLCISKINDELKFGGFPSLDIIRHRDSAKKQTTKSQCDTSQKKYEESDKKSYAYIAEDQYNSLATVYGLERIYCKSEMNLLDKETQITYTLSVCIRNCYNKDRRLFELKESYTVQVSPWKDLDKNPFTHFENIEETGEFAPFFLELSKMATHEQQLMLERVNDTRNYGKRFGADIFNDSIHVYMEKYNYDFPEKNEYYFMEYINGEFHLSVSHNSRFMNYYLKPQEYSENHLKKPDKPFRSYESMEKIMDYLSAGNLSYENRIILRSRKAAYNSMMAEIMSLIGQINSHEIFIRNFDWIYDNEIGQVCVFYNVEQDFECKTIELEDDENKTLGKVVCAGVQSAKFNIGDDAEVIITLEDLKRAFELGFDSIDDICQIKASKGSIDAILQ